LAGGVALNCVANGRILREGPFDELWIQPAAGDAGGALGAALFVWHQLLDQPRTPGKIDSQRGSLLGPAYSNDQITDALEEHEAVYHTCNDDAELCERVAELIDNENVVGWFQGRMEFGPRALGGRSILGDARSTNMQSVMNQKIKFRESFRPFAPIVLREHVDQYFEMRPDQESPYMLIVAPVAEQIRTQLGAGYDRAFGIEKLNYSRSSLPAITHVDYSARVQTVDQVRNPLLHQLMTEFHRRTDCPVLINTSFNVRSEPIVCSPEDAFRCFMMTDMDVLVLGRQIVLKSEQRQQPSETKRAEHLAKFQLD
jgi:carbamoyltransferase